MKKNLTGFKLVSQPDYGSMRTNYFLQATDGDLSYIADPLVFKEQNTAVVCEPFIVAKGMSHDTIFPPELMAIFEYMWAQGPRPHGLEDRNRETGALRDHLDDMRRIALKDKYKK